MHRNSVYKELDLDKFKAGAAPRKEETRDYDKYPIILKNYEYPYQKLLMVLSLFIGGVLAIIVNFDWEDGYICL